MSTLLGYTGFVGKNLANFYSFHHCYNSDNLLEMTQVRHKTIFCAAPSATKWKINQDPSQDARNVDLICQTLEKVECDKIILFSTIDVYGQFPATEIDKPSKEVVTPYGKNRIILEEFISKRFENHHIIRLPGLFGPHLKKNIIFDILNKNQVSAINLEDQFQWFDLREIKDMIEFVISRGIDILNVATEPIKNEELLDLFYNRYPEKIKEILLESRSPRSVYDMKSIYAETGYVHNKEHILGKIDEFINI